MRIGDTVKAGGAIATLDPADLRNTLLNARAQLDAAEHRVAYAKQQLDRDRAQAQANLIAPAQLETTQDAYASAVAQRDSALAQMALAGDHLRYATLTADHDGVITSEDADTGQNVEPGGPCSISTGAAISTSCATCRSATCPISRSVAPLVSA